MRNRLILVLVSINSIVIVFHSVSPFRSLLLFISFASTKGQKCDVCQQLETASSICAHFTLLWCDTLRVCVRTIWVTSRLSWFLLSLFSLLLLFFYLYVIDAAASCFIKIYIHLYTRPMRMCCVVGWFRRRHRRSSHFGFDTVRYTIYCRVTVWWRDWRLFEIRQQFAFRSRNKCILNIAPG